MKLLYRIERLEEPYRPRRAGDSVESMTDEELLQVIADSYDVDPEQVTDEQLRQIASGAV